MKYVKRGEIHYVDLAGNKGSEQGGDRPCLVIQNDVGNKYSPTTIVYPITKRFKKFGATHVSISCLDVDSIILCEQPRTVDETRFRGYICTASAECMEEVRIKTLLSLGLE